MGINNFSTATFAGDARAVAAKTLPLHVQPPLTMPSWSGAPAWFGFGDLETGVKYCSLAPDENEPLTFPLGRRV